MSTKIIKGWTLRLDYETLGENNKTDYCYVGNLSRIKLSITVVVRVFISRRFIFQGWRMRRQYEFRCFPVELALFFQVETITTIA